MLRLSDRGVPPHMLHLYETNATHPEKSTEFHDDAVRLPSVLVKISAHVLKRLKSLRAPSTEQFVPDSAKSNAFAPRETQYLGETTIRDTRWQSS